MSDRPHIDRRGTICAAAAPLLVLGLFAAFAASADIPADLSLGRLVPTPSGIVDTRYRDGDDGTPAIPLLWGTCPTVTLTDGGACTTNLRTLCNLVEAGSPAATLTLLSGTLPTGCSISGDGITGTVSAAGTSQIVVRATRNADIADTAAFTVTATASGTDSADPTIPLALAGVDNADGTATLSWEASGDPNVAGVVTGVASYQVKLGGAAIATVTAPSANVQPLLAATEIGTDTGESSTQSGARWTLAYSGTGLGATSDNIFGRLAQVSGDYTATLKLTSYTPTVGTAGSVGIAARASNSVAGAISVYSRWRDTDDKCNQRYRTSTGGTASNGALSSSTYTPGSMWIKQARVGDSFTTYCSSNSGQTWTVTSAQTVSPGATVYLGPFVTSGSTGNAATAVVDEFVVTQSGSVSYAYTGAGGTFAVNAFDGTNRSDDSATVAVVPTGAEPDPLVSVPAVTKTVCASGCDYQPVHLETVAISERAAGEVLELRTATAGETETWAAAIKCSGVSGTANDPIWVVVRDGDTITLEKSTPGGHAASGVGLIDLTNCDYWNFVGSRDGTSGGLKLADRSRHGPPLMHQNPELYGQYVNGKSLVVRSSTGVAFVGMTISGSKSTHGGFIDKDSTDILFKYVDIGRHGSNVYDFNNDGLIPLDPNSLSSWGDSDSGEILNNCATRVLYDTIYMHHSGHTMLQQCGPYHIVRNSDFNGDWSDVTDYAEEFTGNHMATFLPMRTDPTWSTTHFGPLIENTVFRGVGSEPEHKRFNDGLQLLTKNAILRGNYFVQRAGPDGYWGRFGPNLINSCASFAPVSTTDFSSYLHLYNNTMWGGAVYHSSGVIPAGTYTSASCGHFKVRNNLFQGIQTRMPKNTEGYEHTIEFFTSGSNTGHANAWKSSVWMDNVFAMHPTDPPVSGSFRVELGSKSGGSGGGTALLSDCTTWPDNFCNRVDSVTWDQSGTTTAMANSVATPVPSATAIRAALIPSASNGATMMAAAALTTVDAVTDGTHISLASARYFKDAWGFAYDWGGLHTEYGDCIAIGATAATAVTARITEINYATGDITITPSRTITNGWSVWKAADTGGGTCGAVWDTKGAAQ